MLTSIAPCSTIFAARPQASHHRVGVSLATVGRALGHTQAPTTALAESVLGEEFKRAGERLGGTQDGKPSAAIKATRELGHRHHAIKLRDLGGSHMKITAAVGRRYFAPRQRLMLGPLYRSALLRLLAQFLTQRTAK